MKKQIIIGVSLLVFGTLKAQYTRQYLHLDIGGGLHNLEYNLQNGTEKRQLGYSVNASYSYFFKPRWGIKSGIGIQSFGAHSTLNYLESSRNVDSDGDAYDFQTNYKDWQEKQQALFLDIPLEVQYRKLFNSKVGLLASVGAKISIPLLANYKTTGGAMETTGYYSQWNVELGNMPQHGFGTLMNSYSGNISLKTSYAGIADVGCILTLSKNTNLYLGGYINYGLNSILTPDSKQIYQSDGVYNGIFESNQLTSVNPLAVGVKVGLCWQLKELWSVGLKRNKHVQRYKAMSNQNSTTPAEKQSSSKSISNKDSFKPTAGQNPAKSVNDQGALKTVTGQNSSTPDINQNSSNLADTQSSSQSISSKDSFKPTDGQNPAKSVNNQGALKTVTDQISSTPDINQSSSNLADTQSSSQSISNKDSIKPAAGQNPAKSVNDQGSSKTLTDQNTSKPLAKSTQDGVKIIHKTFKGITFDAGKAVVTMKESYAILDQIVSILVSNPTYLVEVQGFADSEGNSLINKKLSTLRATEVRNYLINKGVDENRITAAGYGATMPVASNKTPEGRSANRRVEFVVSYEEVSFK